jgi:hypothetical protein
MVTVMKKKGVFVFALALLPTFASAQGTKSANFTYRNNLTSLSITYCKLTGQNDQVLNPAPIAGTARIKTTGSSVNVVANTATQGPFTNIAVGDVLLIDKGAGGKFNRVVATRADADTITVDTAVDLTGGFEFRYLKTVCGATVTDGWIDASDYQAKSVSFNLEAATALVGGIDFRIECKGQSLGAAPNTVHPGASGTCNPGTSAGGFCNVTTAGQIVKVDIPPAVVCSQVRVGMLVHTSVTSDAVTVTLDLEKGK